MGDLRRGEAPVDGDIRGVDLRAAEEQLEVLDAVLVEDGHAVGGADALGGERVRDLTRTGVEFADR